MLVSAACGGSSSDADSAGTAARASSTTVAATTSTTAEGATTTVTSTTAAPTTTAAPAPTAIEVAEATDLTRPAEGTIADTQWAQSVASFERYVVERDIGAAVLAIAVDGEPVVEVALGWSDLERTQPLHVDSSFRVASVTKPFTRALALRLASEGRIDLDSQVICTPGAGEDCIIDVVAQSEAAGRSVNEQLSQITLRQLLDHTAGFDRDLSFDPMFAPLLVAADMGLDGLPDESDMVAWALAEPLSHTPGEVYSYSNLGYLIAGSAIETHTGTSYIDLLHDYLGVSDDIVLGSTLPTRRQPGEVQYGCNEGLFLNVFDPEGPEVCWPDGGFNLEAMTAHGRLVAPASAVLDFLAAYCTDGGPNDGFCDGWHDGSLPGTYAIARNFGRIDYVVLLNERTDPNQTTYGFVDLVAEIDAWVTQVVPDPFT